MPGLKKGSTPRTRAAWAGASLAVFMLATTLLHGDLLRAGWDTFIPANSVTSDGEPPTPAFVTTIAADTVFVAWMVARNAHTLVTRPSHFFDTEHCAPAKKSMTLGDPMLTLGIMGIPAAVLGLDPIVTYNSALVILHLVMAIAMYLLVSEWTAEPAAGIVAGLIYSFHPVLTRDVTHSFIYDTSWTVLALYFSERLFAKARWRDALALGMCGGLQIGVSFYAVVASLLIGLPFLVWLLVRHGDRRVRPAQIALAMGLVLVAGVLIYGPYLETRASGDVLKASHQYFADVSFWLPGGWEFSGWLVLLLAACAFALGRRRALAGLDCDPRGPLLVGAALTVAVAIGDNQPSLGPLRLPNIHAALSAMLPGFDAVRAVVRVGMGVHLVASILAGMGAAAILHVCRRGSLKMGAAAVGVVVTGLALAYPALQGTTPRAPYRLIPARPDPKVVEFFEVLQMVGSEGPVLELPIHDPNALAPARAVSFGQRASRIRMTAYHQRPTSACYGSYSPPEIVDLVRLADQLPQADALDRLYALGFETIVLTGRRMTGLRRKLDRRADDPASRIRSLHAAGLWSAYRIEKP